MSDKTIKMITTFFYIGNFPVAPGTVASAVATLLALALYPHPFLYFIVFVAVTVLGFIASEPMEKILGIKDPGCVVIDEVSGILISFMFLPLTPSVIWITFFLFRAFDMFKIYPGYKLEQMGGGYGIMMDDIAAGIYTNLVMQIAVRWAGII